MFTLRDITNEPLREFLGSALLSKAGLGTVGASSITYATANAINYAVDGIAYSKAALSPISFSSGTATQVTQAASQTRYYTVSITPGTTFTATDGTFSTKQSANLGPVPIAGPGLENGLVFSSPAGVINLVTQTYPVQVQTTAAHGLFNGDKVRVDGIGNGGPGQVNGEWKVRRDGTALFSLYSNEGAALDGRAFPAYVLPVVNGVTQTSMGNWGATDQARVTVGVIKIVTSASGSFIPGTTALDATGVTATFFDVVDGPMLDRP